jgi:hypothetical protein
VSGCPLTPSYPPSPQPHTLTNFTLAPPTLCCHLTHGSHAGRCYRSHMTLAMPLRL